jgi:uncharacterized repeat protein (TIGR03803 family)
MHRRQNLLLSLNVLVAMMFATLAASGQSYTVMYNFGSKAGDPINPDYSGVIAQGRDGNLYTTAPLGGSGHGAIFKITPSGTLSIVHSFSGTDGSSPYGGLTVGMDGSLYGTTTYGGTNSAGTIFKVTPGGTLTTLHVFTGADGDAPFAPPIQGTDGNWYGTTFSGGTSSAGTVYKYTRAGVFTTLYSFDDTHGQAPFDELVQASDGNFYGTTSLGGANGYGEVFRITPAGVLTVLHSFDINDGEQPYGPLIQADDGFLYGTTAVGGRYGGGVVFRISLAGTFTLLRSMINVTYGSAPIEGVIQASDGNFYGANGGGGAGKGQGAAGTIFEMTPKYVVSPIFDFTLAEGGTPFALLQHTNGILYGDTYRGGSGNVSPCKTEACGVFYSFSANLPAFVRALPNFGKVGSKIGILGQGFSASSVVLFNGVAATEVTRTGTTFLLATVPAGTSTGYVTVTTGTTILKSLKKFTVHSSSSR